MNNMIKSIINIENNCFGEDLRNKFFELKTKDFNSPEINALIYLFNQTLNDKVITEGNEFLDNFSAIEEIQNIEINGRWYEYLSKRFSNKKPDYLRKAVFYYLDIFKITKDNDYVIHSLKLVKTAKGLFKDEIKDIYEIGKNVLLKLEEPFLQKEIIFQLLSLCPEQTKNDFEEFLKDAIRKETERHNYSEVFWLIESLKKIKAISKIESKVLQAINYENKGDHQAGNKMPNTFYPSILESYLAGLRVLKSIECDENLRRRLESKVIKEQKENLKMHSAYSNYFLDTDAHYENHINDFGDSCIKQFKVFDFESGFSALKSFPSSIKFDIDNKKRSKNFLSDMFNDYMKIDLKGKVVGKTNREKFYEIEDRKILRECIINFLKKAKWKMDEDKILDRDLVYYYILEKCNSKFIPSDRKWLFANGIYQGFNNDFITSAHILIPQLENSLKYILEKNEIVTSKIYEEIQHDNTLGGLLDKYIEINNNELFYELKDFLVENSGVNFRNELCHGLLPPFIIEHYGIYVWWLTLKLIFDFENIFENSEKNS